MVTTTVSGTSFDPRPRQAALAWLLAGMLAALLGRRLLSWIDYNV